MERDGNGWVECDLGHRHWGLHGAAGLLLHSADADGNLRVLLQHRADWCHHGGTWGLPGGARDSHETVEEAALREAVEETALDGTKVRLRHTFVDDHGGWSYTTVYADSLIQLETVPNEESAALEWVSTDRVADLPLHPGFGHTWPEVQLRPLALIVDSANVVGAVPDGWWRDRAGATERLAERLQQLLATTVREEATTGVVCDIHMIIEGNARSARVPVSISTVTASASGDDAVVATTERLSGTGAQIVVVTSDQGLRERVTVTSKGRVIVYGSRWLIDRLDSVRHSTS